jgi:hypothetical protein
VNNEGDNMAQSAGEHQYREIQVRIYPRQGSGQVVVSARQKRGGDLVVDRRLGNFGFALAGEALTRTTAGCLRAAAAALEDAAAALERRD